MMPKLANKAFLVKSTQIMRLERHKDPYNTANCTVTLSTVLPKLWSPRTVHCTIFGPPLGQTLETNPAIQTLESNPAVQTLETNPANHIYPKSSPWPCRGTMHSCYGQSGGTAYRGGPLKVWQNSQTRYVAISVVTDRRTYRLTTVTLMHVQRVNYYLEGIANKMSIKIFIILFCTRRCHQ